MFKESFQPFLTSRFLTYTFSEGPWTGGTLEEIEARALFCSVVECSPNLDGHRSAVLNEHVNAGYNPLMATGVYETSTTQSRENTVCVFSRSLVKK